MSIEKNLPVSYLLFNFRNRINRSTYWIASVFIWTSFYVLHSLLDYLAENSYLSLLLHPLLFWALIATATKRLHDFNRSGIWLLLVFIPVIGPMYLFFLLGFKRGNRLYNRYGPVPGSSPDYHKNNEASKIDHLKTDERIVNDITGLNPIIVSKVQVPETKAELLELIRDTKTPISIGGGRYSMGGQTASSGSLHLDLRKLNKILTFSKSEKRIKVEAGIRWCDIQHEINQHGLSVKIMQSYANFTVGGSLSVNVHGRYIGLGPIILSVKSIELILADGSIHFASKDVNPELFNASIGCYNAIGVIYSVELELTENVRMLKIHKKMHRSEYLNFFKSSIRDNQNIILHNGDLYPPLFKNIRGVSWEITERKATTKSDLIPLTESYPVERFFIGSFAKNKWGKWQREYIIDPLFYAQRKIHWRNYEAGYDVLELEPVSRSKDTFVLQEYFVPINNFEEFTIQLSEIFNRFNVNVINISVRHALPDTGSLLAWAQEEVFAFVVYYKQATHEIEKNKVAIWTRELIDVVLKLQGSYYLPYQIHATSQQFFQAYPNAKQLFELKKKLDPDYKFRNQLLEAYYNKEK